MPELDPKLAGMLDNALHAAMPAAGQQAARQGMRSVMNLRNTGPTPAPGVHPLRQASNAVGSLGKQVSGMGGTALGLGVLGAMGYTAYKGHAAAKEQDARIRDVVAARQQNMTAPLPSMTVMASYDEFANDKLANDKDTGWTGVFPTVRGTATAALANTLSQHLVGKPLDSLASLIKKKYVTHPKQERTFGEVTTKDPMLAQHFKQSPEQLHEAYKVMKDFGPALSTNPTAVRSFLQQAAMSNGNLDYATIRMLAETEKFIQNSRGKGV